MEQTYTSANTSINSTRLPAVYGKAPVTSQSVLDYGCGKYTDHLQAAMAGQGRTLYPYDPFNQPDEVNQRTKEFIRWASANRHPVDVLCSNVLNVIDSDGVIRFIADQIETICARTGGTAYITVYEGNRSGIGCQTGPDQYQRNEPLRDYLKYFIRDAEVRNGMIVVR